MSAILKLCQGVPLRTVEPGTILFAEGKRDRMLCILADGEVEILKDDFQVNTVSEPGAVFGEMSILLDTPHTATVRARTSCSVHMIEDGEPGKRSPNIVRDRLLSERGYVILRLRRAEVERDLPGALHRIKSVLEDIAAPDQS